MRRKNKPNTLKQPVLQLQSRKIFCGMLKELYQIFSSLSSTARWLPKEGKLFIICQVLKERGESEHLLIKVKKELLPCLRSFTSGLRVAEDVWMQGMLIKEYPPEASTIKCIEDSWALLKTEDGQARLSTLNI